MTCLLGVLLWRANPLVGAWSDFNIWYLSKRNRYTRNEQIRRIEEKGLTYMSINNGDIVEITRHSSSIVRKRDIWNPAECARGCGISLQQAGLNANILIRNEHGEEEMVYGTKTQSRQIEDKVSRELIKTRPLVQVTTRKVIADVALKQQLEKFLADQQGRSSVADAHRNTREGLVPMVQQQMPEIKERE